MTSSAALFVTADIRGTKRVQYQCMRKHTVVALSFAVAWLVACDTDRTPTIAGIGGGTTSAAATTEITISPSTAQIVLGGTVQLTTNVPAPLPAQVEWLSLNPTVATVSQSGLVTGGGLGSATIRARLVSDTTKTAAAVVVVVAP
jgi:uncharacterized protein YjdB